MLSVKLASDSHPLDKLAKEQRNENLKRRRALRRFRHEQRKKTFTAARASFAPKFIGFSKHVSDAKYIGMQGGVPRALPTQLPSIVEVRQHEVLYV